MGKVNDLSEGYQKALAMRPELNVQPKPEGKPDISQAEKVRKAKKAATGVKSSGAVAKKNREAMTLEEEIASHFS